MHQCIKNLFHFGMNKIVGYIAVSTWFYNITIKIIPGRCKISYISTGDLLWFYQIIVLAYREIVKAL